MITDDELDYVNGLIGKQMVPQSTIFGFEICSMKGYTVYFRDYKRGPNNTLLGVVVALPEESGVDHFAVIAGSDQILSYHAGDALPGWKILSRNTPDTCSPDDLYGRFLKAKAVMITHLSLL